VIALDEWRVKTLVSWKNIAVDKWSWHQAGNLRVQVSNPGTQLFSNIFFIMLCMKKVVQVHQEGVRRRVPWKF